MLVVTRKTEESVIIAENIEVTILDVSKDRVKIGITAPKDIRIIRNELLDTQEINEDSSKVPTRETLESLFKFKKEE